MDMIVWEELCFVSWEWVIWRALARNLTSALTAAKKEAASVPWLALEYKTSLFCPCEADATDRSYSTCAGPAQEGVEHIGHPLLWRSERSPLATTTKETANKFKISTEMESLAWWKEYILRCNVFMYSSSELREFVALQQSCVEVHFNFSKNDYGSLPS